MTIRGNDAPSGAPGDGAVAAPTSSPNGSAPMSASRNGSSPDPASPGSVRPDPVAPDPVAPESAAPDSAAPESAAPDSAAPDFVAPDFVARDPASQNGVVADTASRNGAAPTGAAATASTANGVAAAGDGDGRRGRSSATWAGTTLDERRSKRRATLLDVGIELLGAADGAPVNVRAVCRAAGLTERYFYESFEDRDGFVREVYALVGEKARDALVESLGTVPHRDSPRAAVGAFAELVVGRPEYGRVLLVAPIREPALGGTGIELAPVFVEIVEAQLLRVTDPVERRIRSTALVGALSALFLAFLNGTLGIGRDDLVRFAIDQVGLASAAIEH